MICGGVSISRGLGENGWRLLFVLNIYIILYDSYYYLYLYMFCLTLVELNEVVHYLIVRFF